MFHVPILCWIQCISLSENKTNFWVFLNNFGQFWIYIFLAVCAIESPSQTSRQLLPRFSFAVQTMCPFCMIGKAGQWGTFPAELIAALLLVVEMHLGTIAISERNMLKSQGSLNPHADRGDKGLKSRFGNLRAAIPRIELRCFQRHLFSAHEQVKWLNLSEFSASRKPSLQILKHDWPVHSQRPLENGGKAGQEGVSSGHNCRIVASSIHTVLVAL